MFEELLSPKSNATVHPILHMSSVKHQSPSTCHSICTAYMRLAYLVIAFCRLQTTKIIDQSFQMPPQGSSEVVPQQEIVADFTDDQLDRAFAAFAKFTQMLPKDGKCFISTIKTVKYITNSLCVSRHCKPII